MTLAEFYDRLTIETDKAMRQAGKATVDITDDEFVRVMAQEASRKRRATHGRQ